MSPGTTKSMPLTRRSPSALHGAFVGRPRDMRLVQRHTQARETVCMRTELAGGDLGRHALVNHECKELRGRVAAAKGRVVVEVTEVERREHFAHAIARAPDVDDDAVGVELEAPKLDVDDVSGAVQLLRGAEHFTVEA